MVSHALRLEWIAFINTFYCIYLPSGSSRYESKDREPGWMCKRFRTVQYLLLRVLDLSRTRSFQPCSSGLWWFIDWLIHSFIFLHHGKNKLLLRKKSNLLAKNLKLFSNIGLIEIHHISHIHVCICLHSLTIKEKVPKKSVIFQIFTRIWEGILKSWKN